MIRNILFDLDDTLFDFHLAERIAVAKTLRHLAIQPSEDILQRFSALNLAQWKLLEQGKLTREQVKIRRYAILFEEIGANCSAKEAAAYYEEQLKVGHYFMDGAEALLKALFGRYRLYLVSNGTASVQESRIASAGIAKYMQGIFISQHIGFNKPRVEFFNFCFAKIPGFKREETVIVGDSLSSDIKGGKNAGIVTVWFHPGEEELAQDIAADYEIRHLLELIPLLDTM